VYNVNTEFKEAVLMRKSFIFSLVLAVCVVILSFACVKTETTPKTETPKNNQVLTVAKNNMTKDGVLEARFLNMLNHNFVYGETFYDDSAIVDSSVLALLDLAEDSYIAEDYVIDYVYNMYGKIYESIDSDKENFVYVVPRGYSVYTHTNPVITDNKDGSFTVVTDVLVSYEDCTEETLKAETIFTKAEDSAFGYNILYSEIYEEVLDTSDC
jgi:hypothetical protein